MGSIRAEPRVLTLPLRSKKMPRRKGEVSENFCGDASRLSDSPEKRPVPMHIRGIRPLKMMLFQLDGRAKTEIFPANTSAACEQYSAFSCRIYLRYSFEFFSLELSHPTVRSTP